MEEKQIRVVSVTTFILSTLSQKEYILYALIMYSYCPHFQYNKKCFSSGARCHESSPSTLLFYPLQVPHILVAASKK